MCSCVRTGPTTGRATIAAVAASVELDVVDATAIGDFTLTPAPVALAVGGDPQTCYVLPTDAAGRPILGHGDPVQTAIGDPDIADVAPGYNLFTQSVIVTPHQIGTTTLDLTWWSVEHAIAVTAP